MREFAAVVAERRVLRAPGRLIFSSVFLFGGVILLIVGMTPAHGINDSIIDSGFWLTIAAAMLCISWRAATCSATLREDGSVVFRNVMRTVTIDRSEIRAVFVRPQGIGGIGVVPVVKYDRNGRSRRVTTTFGSYVWNRHCRSERFVEAVERSLAFGA